MTRIMMWSRSSSLSCSSARPLLSFFQVVAATLLLLRPCPCLGISSGSQQQHPHNIVSTADNALPMSLSTVVSDLEAEGCCAVECDETGAEQTSLTTACLVTSRSVSKRQRVRLLEQLLQAGDISHNDAAGTADQWTAVATTAGLALAQPADLAGSAAAAACACGGTVLFAASDADLERGEGVLDALAPAVEKLLAAKEDSGTQQEQQQQQRHLYVLLMDGQTKEVVQPRLERVAATVLANLVVNQPQQDTTAATAATVTTLQDVFDHGVDYLTPREAAAAVLQHEKTTPAAVAAQVAQLWNPQEMLLSQLTSMTNSLMNSGNGANLAAARTLGPAARQCVREALEQVTAQCTTPGSGEPKLVTNFGQLADAAVQQAVAALDGAVGSSSSKKSSSSSTAQQIRANLRATLDGALQDLWAQQMELLQEAQFDEFKRSLSKLLVSPNLQRDMQAAAAASVAAFAKAARKLVPKTAGSSSWSSSLGGGGAAGAGGYTATAQQQAYRRRLHDYVANRILNAQAAGKFKPLPRKGVTVGLHWLLPKPFGHDYRQEPWTVHATDDMVYVPPSSKLGDVSAADVAAGTWRDQLVPSPAGNDMLYLQ